MTVKSVAIVTGARQGLGRATALRFARDFAAFALVARSKDNLEKTESEAKSAGAEALVLPLISRPTGGGNRRQDPPSDQ